MYKAIIKVRLKEGILDPQGKAVNNALHHLGFASIENVRIGKLIEMRVKESSRQKAREVAEEASKKLLANPVIEVYDIEIIEDEQ